MLHAEVLGMRRIAGMSIEGTCDRTHTCVHMGYGAQLSELTLRACMGNLVRGRSFVCIGIPRFCYSWRKEEVLKGGWVRGLLARCPLGGNLLGRGSVLGRDGGSAVSPV